jgi:phenylalanyl-tRNA synthetase beta chain
MQFPESWLRAYCDPALDSDQLAHALTMAGLEVDESVPVAAAFSRVVVAEVRSVERHPDADKLTICRVDAGTGAELAIVCGAPNAAAGIRVPCALAGAELPGGFAIKEAKVRGVPSQGMLCSARELGLSEDHAGLLVLPDDAPIGADLRQYLRLDERRVTIKLTPNRGDCLSVVGLARETAAITGAPLRLPQFPPVPPTTDERLPVKVLSPDLCGRFSGRVIRGLNAKAPTPQWMAQRLERSGQRPISALVDISNYVMLELGRPSHVFDLDKVRGGLVVRWGGAGESVELLNGQTVEVDDWVGVIADDRGVEALAGVMGGEATAVTPETTSVYVEAAFWWPESIQGRARRFNFGTDAAHRFERGVDYSTTVEHIEYITRLLLDVCGTPATQVGPVDDNVLRLPERPRVVMRGERCRRVLGVPVSDDEIADVLDRLGLDCRREGGQFTVGVPPYRFDLAIEEDLIEEVARLWGFERIPSHPPQAAALMRSRPEALRSPHRLRQQLAAAGYQELVNYSFVDAKWERDFGGGIEPVRVLNPIASHFSVMRTSLIGGLVAALKYNLNRKAARVRVFELGRVFQRDPSVRAGPLSVGSVRQPMRLAALAFGSDSEEQWGVATRRVDFYDVKGDLEALCRSTELRFAPGLHPALHPGRSARVLLAGELIGWLGELHPRWQQEYELPGSPVLFEIDVEPILPQALPVAVPVPRFPEVVRDIALWFGESVPLQQIVDVVSELSRSDPRLGVLREFRLFDLYRPPISASRRIEEVGANAMLIKEKSLAFRLHLQDTERTLSDAEAEAAVAAVVEGLAGRLDARLRQ